MRSMRAAVRLSAACLAVLTLAGVTDSVALPAPDLADRTVLSSVDLLQQSAVTESMQEPEAHALAEACAFNDISKPQQLSRRLEGPENLGRVHDRLDDIGLTLRLGHGDDSLFWPW